MAAKVVVIGRGLSGAMAALSAKDAGADVTLIYKALGRTALSNGLISFAVDEYANNDLPLSDSLPKLLTKKRRHPYHGFDDPVKAILDAAQYFLSKFKDSYTAKFDKLSLAGHFPHEFGSYSKANLAPVTFASSQTIAKEAMLASISGYPISRTKFLAHAWARSINKSDSDLPVLQVDFDLHGSLLTHPTAFAKALDNQEVFEEFLKAIKKALGKLSPKSLIFPPILGLSDTSIAKKLATALNLEVYEYVPAQNSVPGQRLNNMLFAALEEANIKLISAKATGYVAKDDNLQELKYTDHKGKHGTASGDAFILCGGKFLGGGIESFGIHYREPIFDLPVILGGRPISSITASRITTKDFFVEQKISSIGLKVDNTGRPVDEDETVAFKNLFAAGQILSGFDPFADGSSEGVDIVTGIRAGQMAWEVNQ